MIAERLVMVFGAFVLFALPSSLRAATVDVPLALDYRVVEEALIQQVFTDPDGTAEVLSDAIGCNTLVLSDPRVAGNDDGQLRLVTDVHAGVGTPIGSKCRFARTWHGVIETVQVADVEPGAGVVTLRIVDSQLLRADDGKNVLPRFMRSWVRDHVHPRLDGVTIDLGPALVGIDELLDLAFADSAVTTVATVLSGVDLLPETLVATLSFDVPDAPPGWAPADEPPLTDAELAAWDANWQAWDAFATWMIKTLAASAEPELTRALGETLLEARYELRDALARDERNRDPVRELFLQSWTRLAPLLEGSDLPIPGGQALGFASFISAGNALQALDQVAPHLEFRINQDALRAMARLLVPAVDDQALRYDTAVDPELRALLGLDPELADMTTPSESGEGLPGWLLNRLISSAHAAQIDPGLVRRLNTWIPQRSEIDNYLQAMGSLLDAISDAEHDRDKVPDAFFRIYDPLLRATAWQESCWRQNVERDGAIEPIRSSAGSVGLMQINLHVWRGVYDADQVLGDVQAEGGIRDPGPLPGRLRDSKG